MLAVDTLTARCMHVHCVRMRHVVVNLTKIRDPEWKIQWQWEQWLIFVTLTTTCRIQTQWTCIHLSVKHVCAYFVPRNGDAPKDSGQLLISGFSPPPNSKFFIWVTPLGWKADDNSVDSEAAGGQTMRGFRVKKEIKADPPQALSRVRLTQNVPFGS